MKIRKGFVSNSSSSSFVMVLDKELYNKVYAKVSEECHHMLEANAKETSCLGNDAVYIGDLSVMDSSYNFGDCWAALNEFKQAAREEAKSDELWEWRISG